MSEWQLSLFLLFCAAVICFFGWMLWAFWDAVEEGHEMTKRRREMARERDMDWLKELNRREGLGQYYDYWNGLRNSTPPKPGGA